MSAVAERVKQVLDPIVSDQGYDLEALEVQPAGRRRLLRVVVDGERGVDLDAVAALSRAMSAVLDETDAMGDQPYLLEVTSPGVDRPLTQPRHWRRAAGRVVEVVLTDGREVTGRVIDCDDAGATLEGVEGPRTLAYANVRRAQVQVEFTRSQPVDEAPSTRGQGQAGQ
jgi:ribosome maturation factor RimP